MCKSFGSLDKKLSLNFVSPFWMLLILTFRKGMNFLGVLRDFLLGLGVRNKIKKKKYGVKFMNSYYFHMYVIATFIVHLNITTPQL